MKYGGGSPEKGTLDTESYIGLSFETFLNFNPHSKCDYILDLQNFENLPMYIIVIATTDGGDAWCYNYKTHKENHSIIYWDTDYLKVLPNFKNFTKLL